MTVTGDGDDDGGVNSREPFGDEEVFVVPTTPTTSESTSATSTQTITQLNEFLEACQRNLTALYNMAADGDDLNAELAPLGFNVTRANVLSADFELDGDPVSYNKEHK